MTIMMMIVKNCSIKFFNQLKFEQNFGLLNINNLTTGNLRICSFLLLECSVTLGLHFALSKPSFR